VATYAWLHTMQSILKIRSPKSSKAAKVFRSVGAPCTEVVRVHGHARWATAIAKGVAPWEAVVVPLGLRAALFRQKDAELTALEVGFGLVQAQVRRHLE